MKNNIYISSSCIKASKISDSVLVLAKNDFKFIELSGGTNYYENYLQDLLELKEKYGLEYKIHNYFPPPIQHGVINLSSNIHKIISTSFEIIDNAYSIVDSGLASCYSFHAGFLFDMTIQDLGNTSTKNARMYIQRSEGYNNFIENINKLKEQYNHEIIIENNVINHFNFEKQGGNKFMLVNSNDYFEMKAEIDFKLLLDLAHLKVSANTLNLNFEKEFEILFPNSNYIHLSENDGLNDLNLPLNETGNIFNLIANSNCKGKDFTLEIYSGLDDIHKSYNLLLKIL